MKFYGNGLVWDKGKSKPLCRFVDGAFETDDTDLAQKLVSLGYDCVDAEFLNITIADSKGVKVLPIPKTKTAPRKKKVNK